MYIIDIRTMTNKNAYDTSIIDDKTASLLSSNSHSEHYTSLLSTTTLNVQTLFIQDLVLSKEKEKENTKLTITSAVEMIPGNQNWILIGCNDGYVRLVSVNTLSVIALLKEDDKMERMNEQKEKKEKKEKKENETTTNKDIIKERSEVFKIKIISCQKMKNEKETKKERNMFELRVLVLLKNGDVSVWHLSGSIEKNTTHNSTNSTNNNNNNNTTSSSSFVLTKWNLLEKTKVAQFSIFRRLLLQKGTTASITSLSKRTDVNLGLVMDDYWIDVPQRRLGTWTGSFITMFDLSHSATGTFRNRFFYVFNFVSKLE